jgi:20S proteasome alpha/beta subunit
VTIVAGFRFNGGVILCADTQETIGEYSKSWTPKLVVKPTPWYANDSPDDLMIAFGGAGDGPFTDKIIDRAWEDVQTATSYDEACNQIEQSIKNTHREYGQIFQNGYLPDVELVYGVKMHGHSKLFKSSGPLVKEVDYAAAGIGMHLANFLTDRLHQRYLPGPQAVILAAYVLFQCIEHVDGCGGDPHIAGLNEAGKSSMINPVQISLIVDQLKEVRDAAAVLLLNAPDFSMKPEVFDKELQSVVEKIKEMRRTGQHLKEIIEKMQARPSGAETSAPVP